LSVGLQAYGAGILEGNEEEKAAKLNTLMVREEPYGA